MTDDPIETEELVDGPEIGQEAKDRTTHYGTAFTLGVIGGCILVCLVLGLPLIKDSVYHREKHMGNMTVVGQVGSGWVMQRTNRELIVAKLSNQAPILIGDKIKDLVYRDGKDGVSEFVSVVKDESDGRDKYPVIIVVAPNVIGIGGAPGWTIRCIVVDTAKKTVEPSNFPGCK